MDVNLPGKAAMGMVEIVDSGLIGAFDVEQFS